MKYRNTAFIAPLMAVAIWSMPASAAIYTTEGQALATCGADEVVFINLDQSRFYRFGEPEYGYGRNGAFACMSSARRDYRRGDSTARVTTTTVTRQTTIPRAYGGSSTTVTETTTTERR